MANTFLVTGAGGQLGRRVLELLVEAKPGKLIATTRNPDKLADFARQGVEVRGRVFLSLRLIFQKVEQPSLPWDGQLRRNSIGRMAQR